MPPALGLTQGIFGKNELFNHAQGINVLCYSNINTEMTKVIQNKGQIRNDYYETSCKTYVSVNYQIGIYSIMSSLGSYYMLRPTQFWYSFNWFKS